MDEYIVKFRLVHFYVETTNPQTGDPYRTEKTASHGMRLHAEDGPVSDSTNIYNVPQDQLDWLDKQGAFFTAAEIAAAESGVTDTLTTVESTDSLRGPLGDTASSLTNQLNPDVDPTSAYGGGDTFHPLTFAEMSGWQVEEFLRLEEPTPEDILDIVHNEQTPEARAALLAKFIDAENTVTKGEPREELIQLAAAEGGYAAHGPSGSEGIEGTADDAAGAGAGPESEENPGGVAANTGRVEATDAAASFALEHNVNLADVPHEGDKVTQPDVQAFVKQRDGS